MDKTTILATTAAILVLLPASGCRKGQQEALAFNDAIVGANKRLEEAARAFGVATGQAMLGRPQEATRVRAAYQTMLQTFQRVKADMRALKVPPSKSAQTLYDVHQRFLQSQENYIQNDFAEIPKILEDPTLSNAIKSARVQAILARVEQSEKSELVNLQNAQREFARQHKIILR